MGHRLSWIDILDLADFSLYIYEKSMKFVILINFLPIRSPLSNK